MSDPVSDLRAALDEYDRAKVYRVTVDPRRLADTARALLDALPRIQADAWQDGYEDGVEDATDGTNPSNPFRPTSGGSTP